MSFFREWGRFMMMGARAHALWEIEISNRIFHDRKRIILLLVLMLPIVPGGFAFAAPLCIMYIIVGAYTCPVQASSRTETTTPSTIAAGR